MKGYRTPSWFRMKGLLGKKQARAQSTKLKRPKVLEKKGTRRGS